MKASNETPTNHILIALMDYRVDYKTTKGSKYGFGYFKLEDILIQYLNKFHDDWEKGKRRIDGIIIHIPEMFLVDRDFIFNKVSDNEDSNYRGIKLDSINFVDSKPPLEYPNMIKGSGYIHAFRNGFYIQCEDIVEMGISLTIYRSTIFSYWRINHLLLREKPI